MHPTVIPRNERPMSRRSTLYDPELLFVECAFCGSPVVWDNGEATEFVAWLGVEAWAVDSSCMILTHGCMHCAPEAEAYRVQMVRGDRETDSVIPEC